ncbi:hypothetical protein [Thermomonospora cellulosilytica]|uniref:PD-(D/E)XK endonuclease-like domain-containing protein n=1 Tax=Thermomonospora cellulosilytica TaxID=1411118 RepID=A0A7W3MXP8_9ACTN|nr:hypothetical protein [Thermomonospora cellulosilytica]MBA9003756.1 hypothetical protein [Thermomonospora cellulosilytica]
MTRDPAAQAAGNIDTSRVGWPTPADLEAVPDPAEQLRRELMWAIENRIDYAPRSLQTRLGPSELGHPCARKLGYKLAGVEISNPGDPAWYPTIGTAVHGWLEEVMRWLNGHLGTLAEGGPRFLLEHKVSVGEICGEHITGTCDVYDRVTGIVVDWKVVGEKQLKKYKDEGPGDQYRAQAHLYGRGWQRRGMPVTKVAVMFLPRDRMLHAAHMWSEPYDEQIAVQALTRAEGITTMVRGIGKAALPMLPTADAYCTFCDYFLPGSTELEEACPGHPGATGYLK